MLTFKQIMMVLLLSTLCNSTLAEKFIQHTPPQATAEELKISYWDAPVLAHAYITSSPIEQNDGISVGELGVDGGNEKLILKFAQEIAEGLHGDYDSLLIHHRGKLLFESYYNRGRINLPHFQASASKSYIGFALGRAIQLGYLTMEDLDKPLIGFLKELAPEKLVKGAEKVTLRHALMMRSGIRINEQDNAAIKKHPEKIQGQKQVQAWLEHSEPITKDSQRFKYGKGAGLIAHVLDATVPGGLKQFLQKELLDKMEMTYDWRIADSGLAFPGHLTSRDMVKWGILAENRGKWQGEQLIPEDFVNKALSRAVDTKDVSVYLGGKDTVNQSYGYLWWGIDMKVDNKLYYGVSAEGGGGQFIMLIEELELMVVITAGNFDFATKQQITENILPAFIE